MSAPQPAQGSTATCMTCQEPITFETRTEPGYLPKTGWFDRFFRDGLVCFSAADLTHRPDREGITPPAA